ncbi:MAG: hypothetical protein ABIG55_04950 [Candidatus Omnitrophota bacterium]|nr:hypothetical protein [Candidatus Omnitrophota bacterium]
MKKIFKLILISLSILILRAPLGLCEQELAESIEKDYYDNGALKSEITYLGGKANGPARYYHENGLLSEEYLIKDDKVEDGIYVGYDKSGQPASEIIFKNGERISDKLIGASEDVPSEKPAPVKEIIVIEEKELSDD